MSRLGVGWNLTYLKPGQVGGSEEYACRTLRALGDEAPGDVELTLFVNRRFGSAHGDLAEAHPTVVAPISGNWPAMRIAFESTWLPRQTANRPLDLVHHQANTIPYLRSRPAVVTIHDLQPYVRPGDFARIKGAYLRSRLRAAAREARVIVTPSDYVRRLVRERFDLDDARVVTVQAPVPACHVPNDVTVRPPGAGRLGRFFLYPAITHPHKNHLLLIRAFARVAATHPDVSLVLTGGRGSREHAVLGQVRRYGLRDRVRRLGRVAAADLDVLFQRAVALTVPSRHEGYGLPVTEAMARGCPVVASNVTALPEVVGDAGVLVDPDDVDGWAGAMAHVLDDDDFRAALAAGGYERVRSLTPAATATRLVGAYRLALDRA